MGVLFLYFKIRCKVIDSEGFRLNVGIVICNKQGQLLWAKRVGFAAWQFPQGGIQAGETPIKAMYRELREEVGLLPSHVRVLGQSTEWLKYYLPHKFIRKEQQPPCIGQKQKWFLLQLESDESNIQLNHNPKPEFDHWCWVSYWYPVNEVVDFKQDVYRKALKALHVYLPTPL